MGSLGGHMNHLWEDLEITFGELNEILYQLCLGNLRVTEKFDGINLHFRVDASGNPRFSTNKKQRDAGGLTQPQFCSLMENHPAGKTFINASEAIFRIVKKNHWPFGFSGRNWINCDIIDNSRPMTLKYDSCSVVLHGVRNFNGDTSDHIKEAFLQYATESAKHSVDIDGKSWRILAPADIQLLDISGQGVLSTFQAGLNKIMLATDCNESSKIKDFAKESIRRGPLSNLNISENKKNQLLSHIFKEGNTSLIKIKNGVNFKTAKMISEIGLAKNRSKVINQAVLPLELLITHAGAKILENLNSVIIENPSMEIDRLKNCIKESISLTENYKDSHFEARNKIMENYVSKLERCGNIIPTLEGIVFNWDESSYKITGNFAPINHILGITRYGRGKIPPVESITENALWEKELLNLMTRF
jgi:hypothetical protein